MNRSSENIVGLQLSLIYDVKKYCKERGYEVKDVEVVFREDEDIADVEVTLDQGVVRLRVEMYVS